MPAEGVVRTLYRTIAVVSFLVVLSSCSSGKDPSLTIFTYDSFVADWGAAPKIGPLFEKQTGIKVNFVAKGDGGALLSAIVNERGKPFCDIALGLDNQLSAKALASDLFATYEPKGIAAIPAELRIDPKNRLQPFDYGHFAFIWDSEKLKNPPATLADLTKPEYARKIIIMDPRTSTPGLGLVSWTKSVYGEGWKDYWRALKPSILTMTPGWDTGYGLFTSGEAPLVLSYATSPAYHKENDKTDRYVALLFPEGHPVQIELAGIVKNAKHRKNAEKFMDFLVSEACQKELPATQWMYPALGSTPLPASFSAAPKPAKTLVPPLSGLEEDAKTAADILSGVM